MVKVGIVGGTGYTGVELLRLLAQHPHAQLKAITSRKDAGTRVSQMFPSLRGRVDLAFVEPAACRSRIVRRRVLRHAARRRDGRRPAPGREGREDHRPRRRLPPARPHRMEEVVQARRTRAQALDAQAVYGLPEVNRDRVRKARVVGNPGCYRDRGAARFPAAHRGGRRRSAASDRRREIRRVGRGPQGGGEHPVLRGLRQLLGVRRRGAPPRAGDQAESAGGRAHADRPDVRAASHADDPRHPRDAVRAHHAGKPTSRRCSRSATRTSRSSTCCRREARQTRARCARPTSAASPCIGPTTATRWWSSR